MSFHLVNHPLSVPRWTCSSVRVSGSGFELVSKRLVDTVAASYFLSSAEGLANTTHSFLLFMSHCEGFSVQRASSASHHSSLIRSTSGVVGFNSLNCVVSTQFDKCPVFVWLRFVPSIQYKPFKPTTLLHLFYLVPIFYLVERKRSILPNRTFQFLLIFNVKHRSLSQNFVFIL